MTQKAGMFIKNLNSLLMTASYNVTDTDNISQRLFLNEVRTEVPLPAEEEKALLRSIQIGDNLALSRIVKAYSKLVYKFAKRFKSMGVPVMDLVQEGLIALTEAAKHFDEKRGAPFLAYAKIRIKGGVLRAFNENVSIVRTPVEVSNKARKAQDKIFQELHREPTEYELAESLKLSTDKVRKLRSTHTKHESIFSPAAEGEKCLAESLAADWTDRPDVQMMLHAS